ncbi:hypothetical protein ACFQV2_16205 [Actinokineospora soli]|uniref:Uncharacterized protein n=1 Tax=Actinokineospora soli TaxID=1048753 RepID=A0ABW2TNN1_9PSEU
MPYLLSAMIVAAVLILAFGLVSALRRAGRLRAAVGAARAGLADRSGLVRARAAALRVAIDEKKRSRERVESVQRGETGGRP